MAVTDVGMNPELRQRKNGLIAESNGNCWMSEGVRSYADQVVFWLKALVQHPLNPQAWAARPGTSNHEKGLAVDVACKVGFETKRALLAIKWGLKTPLANELWHMELAEGRGPMPGHQSSTPTTGDDDEMQPDLIVDVIDAPGGGTYALQRDGGVLARGPHGETAPPSAPTFYGSYPGLSEAARRGARYFVRFGTHTGTGYTLVSNLGERYSFPG